MTYSINEMRKLTDDQLINEHDNKAQNTVADTQYYLDELDRRSRARTEKVMLKLTFTSAVASIIAIIVSTIAILK